MYNWKQNLIVFEFMHPNLFGRDIKIMQCKHKLSHFYLDYFIHVAFREIFKAFSEYIVLKMAKTAMQSSTTYSMY